MSVRLALAAIAIAFALACKKPTPEPPEPGSIGAIASPASVQATPRRACGVDVRTRELLGNAPSPIACGSLGPDASPAELTRARDCVLKAAAAQQPFSLQMQHRGVDSRVESGIVGTGSGGTYRLFWIHYDGCPRGCGDRDPHALTQTCTTLSDVSKTTDPVWPPVGLRCDQAVDVDRCP